MSRLKIFISAYACEPGLGSEIGVGWLHTKYDKFECEGCGRRVGKGRHDYFGPTKAAINLVYVF